MAILITDPSNAALTGVAFTIERGVPSAAVAVKIKNTGGANVAGASVVLYAEQTPGGGTYVTSGQAVVDERMGRFQITSVDSSGTPGQAGAIGVTQTMGANAVALLPTILPGNSVFADIWLEEGTSSSASGTINVRFEIAGDATAIPLAAGISEVASGVLTEVGQPYSFLISGRVTTATGTPDADVHSAAGSWLLNGVGYTDGSARATTFNQNDSAASALTAGQKYYAALTQSSANAPTVTKGLRGTAPARPSPPSTEVLLAWITVNYQAGTSIIATADIENVNGYGRLLVTAPATGLSVTVYSGRSITGDFMQVHSASEVVSLTASATNYIWMQASGIIVKTTSATPPSPGALLLATAVTSGSAVTTLTDLRTYISGSGVAIPAHASTHATAGSDPVSASSIGAAATSHTHAEADVTSLASDLAAKASITYVNAATAHNVAGRSADYTASTNDGTILCDATGGSFTVFTYTAVGNIGKTITVKKTDDSDNTVTVDGNASETVDGFPTFVLTVEGDAITVQSDGANWKIIGYSTFRPSVVDPTFSIGTGAADPYQMPYDQETIFTTPKSAAGAFTMNLPNAGVGGITLLIIKNDSTANVVTIAALAGNSIHDGASTGSFTLGTEGKWVKLVSSGSFGGNKWWVVGKN